MADIRAAKAPGTPRRDKAGAVGSWLEKLGLKPGSRNVIGIQITPQILRIIEIDKGVQPPRIINFSSIDPLMEDLNEAADQIQGLMREKGITGRVVHSQVCDVGVEHRLVSLPVLGKNEMQAVVRREIKKIIPDASPGNMAFDYWFDKSFKRGGRKADVLIGVVPKDSPARIISLMEKVELETQLISTVPLSLVPAMISVMGEQVKGKFVSMIHLERDRSFLVISKGDNWVFSREFQSVLSKEEKQKEGTLTMEARRKFASARFLADQQRLLIEVNRSFLYFKQRFRGEGVSLALLSGEAFNLDQLAEEFQKNLGIETRIFSPKGAFQFEHLGDRADKLQRIFPSLILPVGAAVDSPAQAKLNFVPPAYITRRKKKQHRLMMIAASIVFVVVMFVGYVGVRNTRVNLERTRLQNSQYSILEQLDEKLKDIAVVTARRDSAEVQRSFLDQFSSKHGKEKGLLIALSYLVPPDMLLYNLSLDPGKNLQIVGQVKGKDLAGPDETFNRFFNRLKEATLFSEIAEPVITTRLEQDSWVLSFKLDCKLKS